MTASYRFTVNGRVQGVGFRQATRHTARRLGLDGWVRNREDGAVEGCVRGAEPALAALQDWLRRGPPAARVDALDWQPGGEVDAPDFEIRP